MKKDYKKHITHIKLPSSDVNETVSKFKISNPARFWFGASMFIIEVLGISIYCLTLLDWKWVTEKVILTVFIITAILLYNVLAGILIFNGSKNKK